MERKGNISPALGTLGKQRTGPGGDAGNWSGPRIADKERGPPGPVDAP